MVPKCVYRITRKLCARYGPAVCAYSLSVHRVQTFSGHLKYIKKAEQQGLWYDAQVA